VARTGIHRLSVLLWYANQRRTMSMIGIAHFGGPTPAKMIGLVVLAESLGHQSAVFRKGIVLAARSVTASF
jgi:hypothetical protein